MSPKYRQIQFESELIDMLKEARVRGEFRVRIKARDLHKRIVDPVDNRMPMACAAMWKLESPQNGKATVIYEPKNLRRESSTLEIEFDTADLPE